MNLDLDALECRVLGALIEKEMATPEYYPLSLNALVNACNQRTNRDPMMSLSDGDVEAALDKLEERRLAEGHTGSRVVKYGHRLGEHWNLPNSQMSVLCVLLLRGPQTSGELRTRTQSLHGFEDLEAVESALHRLQERELVVLLPRQPGSREPRWAHLVGGPVSAEALAEQSAGSAISREPLAERVARLELEVAELRDQVRDLVRQLS